MAFVAEDDVLELMEAVFGAVFVKRGGSTFPAPPWPRSPGRGDEPLGLGPPRPAVRPRAARPLHRRSRRATSRFSSGASPGGAAGANPAPPGRERRAARLPRSDRDPHRVRQAVRRQGPRLAFVQEDGTACARRSRSFLSEARFGNQGRSSRGRATCCSSSPRHASRPHVRCWGRLPPRARTPLDLDRRADPRRALVVEFPDVRR